jgi:hypothetical protein
MADGAKPNAADNAEGKQRRGVAVHDGLHVRASAVDLAVNEAFEIDPFAFVFDRFAIEIKDEDVIGRHQGRRTVARE